MKLFTSCLLMTAAVVLSSAEDYWIEPDSVDDAIRDYWCQSQETQCPLICLQLRGANNMPRANSCDPETLDYSCICSNGMEPNITQYSQTIPFFLCQEWGNQCVANCEQGNNLCADGCRSKHPCGAQHPKRIKTSAVATPTSDTYPTTGLGNIDPLDSDNLAPGLAPMSFDGGYSLALVLCGIFLGFAVLL